MNLSISNIGIMFWPKDSKSSIAMIQVGLAKAFDFARGAVFEGYKSGLINSSNASAAFLENLDLGIAIHVGYGKAEQGLGLPGAPVSNIRLVGFWVWPSFN